MSGSSEQPTAATAAIISCSSQPQQAAITVSPNTTLSGHFITIVPMALAIQPNIVVSSQQPNQLPLILPRLPAQLPMIFPRPANQLPVLLPKPPQYVTKSDGSKASRHVSLQPMDPDLLKLLPAVDHTYRPITFVRTSDVAFTATFESNIFNREQFVSWKRQFESQTSTQLSVESTPRVKSKRVTFTQTLSCIHNVSRGKFGYGKHTGCPARLKVTIRCKVRTHRKERKCPDVDVAYPCLIVLTWNHNHSIMGADILRHQTVCPAVNLKLENMYKNGHSALTAFRCIKMEIEDSLEEGGDLELALANRSVCPDYQHCYYLFKKRYFKEYGNTNTNEHIADVVKLLNDALGEESIVCECYESAMIVAICTPFMKRVHAQVPEAAELVCVDSLRGLDRKGFRTYLFTTRSKAGALPLAVGITPSESVEALTKLFSLIQHVLPGAAFYNKGCDVGPHMFMTDDSIPEQLALSNAWPMSTQYLSQFHVLQAQWRLLLGDHRISAADRPLLFQILKTLILSESEDNLYHEYEVVLSSALLEKYPSLRQQLLTLVEKRSKWCSAYRRGSLLLGDHYTDDSMRILKDVIFHRIRKFNLVQMSDFITLRLSAYYERRLLDYAHNRLIRPLRLKQSSYTDEQIKFITDDIYEIESSDATGSTYTVNMAVCICTCSGKTMSFCEHIYNLQMQTNRAIGANGEVGQPRMLDSRKAMYLLASDRLPDDRLFDGFHNVSVTNADIKVTSSSSKYIPTMVAGQLINLKFDIGDRLQKAHATFTGLLKVKMLEHAGSETPEEALKAYEAAIETLEGICTSSEATSALHTFGHYDDAHIILAKRSRLSKSGRLPKRRRLQNAPI